MRDPRFVFPGEESDEVVIVRTGLIRQRLSTTTGDEAEDFSIEFTDIDTSTTDTAEYTFSGASFGTASASRRIVVVAVARAAGSTLDIAGITIGGVAGTKVGASARNTASGVNIAVMYIADVPDGTTGDVVVTWNEPALRAGIAVYALKGAGSAVESDSGTSTANAPTATLDVPAGGGAIGGGVTAGVTSFTPTNLAEDADADIESNITFTAASTTAASGSTALTLTPAVANNPAGIFAAWGP